MSVRHPDTLETRVGQMLFVGFEGLQAPDYLIDWLRAGRIGGVILFARNIASPAQTAELTRTIHDAAAYGALISIDQEGGTVARLREGFSESPGAMALASARNGERLTERVSHMLAVELRVLGIDWDYAPVVDISYNADNPSVGTRSFGSDPARVGALAAAAVRGFQSGGVAACAKHFPGLGDTPVDTHLALPALDTPAEHLLAYDLVPYRAAIAAGVASVMVTHVMYNALDSQHPATLSPIVVNRLLRGELGFDGVVTTDCLEMRAIADHYGPGETAVLAALAGIDSILFSHTRAAQEAAYDALLSAARDGRLPLSIVDAANRRLAAFKAAFLRPPGSLADIGTPEHAAIAEEAARAGVTVVRRGSALPLGGVVGVVEFASVLESGIVERGGQTGFARALKARLPHAEVLTMMSAGDPAAALALAERVDTLVLAVRNAHLIPEQLAAARQIMQAARQVALVCLRNPYDASALDDADSALCTCGDSTPSLAAAVAALMGDYEPDGVLPVQVALA